MQFLERVSVMTLCAASLLAADARAADPQKKEGSDKIPVTTSSEEARQLYLKGRDLTEKLRATDSRRLFEQAAAKDKTFALAQVGLANSAGSAKEFFDAVKNAVALADKASEPERLMILGLDAGVKGDVAGQRALYTKLTTTYPNDERGYNLLGGHYFGQQDYAAAVAAFQKAAAINPSFSPPYNLLGYSYRFMGKYAEAERAFKKYIELIPNDPNPYDSYAELLMKMGRFDDSIRNYEKALSVDPNFVASYVGIGCDQVFQGRGEEARKTYAKLAGVARNDGEKRQALFRTALSYVHEGATDKALLEVQKMMAIAEAGQDMATVSGDQNLMGNILLEAGRPEPALEKFTRQVEAIEKASVPAEVKEAVRRNALYDEARVALARKDLPTAKARAASYAGLVAAKKIPFEVRQQHELLGRIALETKDHAAAVAELEQANQQDPRVLYLLAVALQGKGDAARAREVCARAADFNGIAPNYAYVRSRAKQMLAKS
jgi:tetratricopeptide (TPR) repeat protein